MKKSHKVIVAFILICFFGWLYFINFHKQDTSNNPRSKSYDGDTTGKSCLVNKEYSVVTDPTAPVLSLPFDTDDFSSEFWGIVPFCADQWELGRLHNAIDFETKPDAKIYAAADAVIRFVKVGENEGAGDIIDSISGDYKIGYAGLTNVQIKAGDKIKRGDYLGDAAVTPYGEYHLHLDISLNGTFECPIKYMDQEFKEALGQMFAESHYPSESKFPCACNCEEMESDLRAK